MAKIIKYIQTQTVQENGIPYKEHKLLILNKNLHLNKLETIQPKWS